MREAREFPFPAVWEKWELMLCSSNTGLKQDNVYFWTPIFEPENCDNCERCSQSLFAVLNFFWVELKLKEGMVSWFDTCKLWHSPTQFHDLDTNQMRVHSSFICSRKNGSAWITNSMFNSKGLFTWREGAPANQATRGGLTAHTFLSKMHWSVYMLDRVAHLPGKPCLLAWGTRLGG